MSELEALRREVASLRQEVERLREQMVLHAQGPRLHDWSRLTYFEPRYPPSPWMAGASPQDPVAHLRQEDR